MVVSTLIGIFGGKSSSTSATDSRSWVDVALSVTPYVFILGVASMIALLLEAGIAVINHQSDALQRFFEGSRVLQKSGGWAVSFDYLRGRGTIIPNVSVNAPPAYVQAHWEILNPAWNWHLLSLLAVFIGLFLFLSCRVNLNEFSMNLFYRNRLVRAYLGASDSTRKPSPFTGFDPDDDLHLKSFRADNCYSGPLPLINCALNLVSGKDLAWQERKAESFVLTPLRCGFDTWLEQMDLKDEYSPVRRSAAVQKYGFRPTAKFGFSDLGLRLGTAISISGAAASPNMGYHSSPSLAFLMTLFNVRLGFWAGNPRHDKTWMRPGPTVGLLYLLAELFGQTDDEARYVYLSDGGHFENLGLYELVKRRCKYIIASDADSDGSYAFGDIGNAIRKIREDIGVEIELNIDPVFPGVPIATSGPSRANGAGYGADNNEFSEWHWGIGKIRYGLVDPNAEDGILVYLKTSITGDEPSDVINYRRQHSEFPHESTANQWFTESQFESYRRLGQHVVESLFNPLPTISSGEMAAETIFATLHNQWTHSSASEKVG